MRTTGIPIAGSPATVMLARPGSLLYITTAVAPAFRALIAFV